MNKLPSIRILRRPGFRWLAATGASVAETLARRRPTIVQPLPGKVFLHRHVDGKMVLPDVYSRMTPQKLKDDTYDIFCFGYTPAEGDTVLDIGAGWGEEAITFSRLVGTKGRVIGIEAHPDTYRRLVLNCKYNHLHNVTPLQLAVADVEGIIAIDDGRPGGAGSVAAKIAGSGNSNVQAVTIDSIVSSHDIDCIDLVKMNIEGAEQLAIRGMSKSLTKIRHVAISCHDFVLQPGFAGGDPAWFATYDIVTTFLEKAGFKLAQQRLTDTRPWVQFYVYGSRA